MKKIFVVLITLFCLVTINVASIVTFAAERQIVEKLLVITNEETSAIFENSEDYENIEFVDIDSVDDSFSNYISYAVAIADSMNANINQIFTNGTTAFRLYRKYTEPITGRPAICLPSTSPANAAWSLQRLEGEWSRIRTYLDEQPAEADL